MVDPIHFTKFDRTVVELEEMALFSLLVAGKNALTTAKGLDRFLQRSHIGLDEFQPFVSLRPFTQNNIETMLSASGIGCYKSKSIGVHQLVHSGIDLRTCSADDLEKIHGIGLKTSRMFILHSRRNAEVACLDVHILRYMADRKYDVPKTTPSSKKKYLEIQDRFLTLARGSGLSVAEFDLQIWNNYRKKSAA
jgi:hypothetical protein